MHAILSLLITFTFFISHHVTQTLYEEYDHNHLVNTSWLIQQICSTVDFHPKSKWFNYIFGGFNTHVAHHLFPAVSHVHYPALTGIITEVLQNHRIPYHAISYWGGVKSHLQHLKNMGHP
jgi:linoleoyl-CoA desaturase